MSDAPPPRQDPKASLPTRLARGLGVTFKQVFRKDVTEEYPKEIQPPPPRSHIGRHQLNKHDNGL
jgi:NADH-quinone oxidoreductase subunit I